MYGNLESVKEGSVSNVLKPGVHVVSIDSLVYSTIATPNYSGEVADMVIKSAEGKELKERIFPFKFNTNFKNKDGQPIDMKTQQDDYLAKHMHLFNKAVGEERYKQAVSGATSFGDYINRISAVVCKNKGGQDFKILVVDKGGYSKYPFWSGGSAETIDSNKLVFDMAKHGPKPKPEDLLPSLGGAGTTEDDLPF